MKRLALFVFLAVAGFAPAAEPATLRVALYADKGTSDSKAAVKKVIEGVPGVALETVTADDIRGGKLKGFAVVAFPGGSGGGQGKALEEKGRDEVRAFVKDGGKYLGICAGAYLATTDYDWSLGILNAKVVDRAHWARGHGPVTIAFTDKGKDVLAAKAKESEIVYWQGPLLAPGASKDVPAFDSLATYATEIAENGAPKGVMPGTTAVAAGTFGKGKVLCFGPHPEKTDATHALLTAGLAWLAGK